MLPVLADAQSKVYGSADPLLTFTHSGLQGDDTNAVFTGGLVHDPGETVAGGPYAINQGTLSAGVNYTIEYTGNFLDITPYLLSVVADAQSKVYGSADPFLSFTHGSLQGDDIPETVFTGFLTRDPGESVAGGPYAINQGTLDAGSNYTIDYTGNFLDITPYLLTVVADAQSKVYGSADPVLTYTHGTLQNDDDNSVFTGGLVRNPGETVAGGPYEILQGTLDAGSNYTIEYTSNFLDITPYLLTVVADAQSKVYGSADPGLTYTHGALQNEDGDSIFTGGLVRDPGETVADGPYAINQGTLSAGSNYEIVYEGNFLTITPYLLQVLADAQSKLSGDPDPLLTYTHGQLQNGDDDSVFTGGLVRDPGEDAGQYPINQGTLTAGSNYEIEYIGNFLTIEQRIVDDIPIVVPAFVIDPINRPIISVANQAIVYDASFEPIETLTIDTNVSIAAGGAAPTTELAGIAPAGGVDGLADIEPAAGGKKKAKAQAQPQGPAQPAVMNVADLANIEPAAGGAVGTDIACANGFLDNNACPLQ